VLWLGSQTWQGSPGFAAPLAMQAPPMKQKPAKIGWAH
jgi:hypothetical protein